MSSGFENATPDIADMQQRLELFMGTCQRCGRCFTEPTPLEQLMLKGYRMDDLKDQRWVYRATSYLGAPTGQDIPIELE
jgi:hydrogenase-4 component H